MTYCKICECEIEYIAWKKHVEAHKRKYCVENGKNPDDFFKANWGNVLQHFGVEVKVKKVKQKSKKVSYASQSHKEQKSLGDW